MTGRRGGAGSYPLGAAFLAGLLLATAGLGAQAAAWSTDPLALQDELGDVESLLARGASPTESEVAAAASIAERAQAEANRALRTRASIVAYLARETKGWGEERGRAEERIKAAVIENRRLQELDRTGRGRFVGFRVSLGACVLFLGVYDVLQYLGESAFARFASAGTAAEAQAARLGVRTYDTASAAAAGAFVLALGAFLLTAAGAATSAP